MKKIFLLAAALTLSVAGFASANEKDSIDNPENGIRGGVNATMPGDLTGAPTFDRRFLVTYDGTCAAPSSDSGNDGTAYQVFPIVSPSGQAADIEVVLGTLGDSVLFIYCDPFDPAQPDQNLRAWDDDGGAGLGSAIVPGDGVMLDAGVTYYAVVTGFGLADIGTFDINLGGDLQFGSGLPETTPVPVDNVWAMLALVALLAVFGYVVIRRIG